MVRFKVVVMGMVIIVVGYWWGWKSSGGFDCLCKGSSCNTCLLSATVKCVLHWGVGGGDGDCSFNGGGFDYKEFIYL